ncbi:MAG: hypothetical protein GY869_21895, partial [Planctomycetes bacterium]|nr:hypothetical protein [Planctomycetota bacterium]
MNNSAHFDGGGIHCSYSNLILTNVTITGNSANRGGGIYCFRSNPLLANVTITGNSANQGGGGIFCEAYSNPTLLNSILFNNSPQEIYFYLVLGPNSVTIAYSDLMGGEAGIVTNNNGTVNWLDGNIDQDPLFVDPDGDYHLQPGSPCIDAGIDFFVWGGDTLVNLTPDQYIGPAPDMGAFESPGSIISGHVDLDDTNDESGVKVYTLSYSNFFVLTDIAGFYELPVSYGTHTITARKLGYQYGYVYDVVVDDDLIEDIDFVLDLAGPAPINLIAESNHNGYIPLTWDEPDPEPVFYRVYRHEDSDDVFTMVADSVLSTNYVDVNVQDLVSYYYVVTAVSIDPDGESFYSNEAIATAGLVITIGYANDFEADDGGFDAEVIDGTSGFWEWGQPTVGPDGAYSGDHCWGTGLAEYYGGGIEFWLISPHIDLTNQTSPYIAVYSWW